MMGHFIIVQFVPQSVSFSLVTLSWRDASFAKDLGHYSVQCIIDIKKLQLAASASERCDISSHTNHRYLSTPEMNNKMKNMKSKIKNQKQELKKLRLKLDQVTQETGIEVDEELTDHFKTIIHEATQDVHQKHPLDSFKRIFGSSK